MDIWNLHVRWFERNTSCWDHLLTQHALVVTCIMYMQVYLYMCLYLCIYAFMYIFDVYFCVSVYISICICVVHKNTRCMLLSSSAQASCPGCERKSPLWSKFCPQHENTLLQIRESWACVILSKYVNMNEKYFSDLFELGLFSKPANKQMQN